MGIFRTFLTHGVLIELLYKVKAEELITLSDYCFVVAKEFEQDEW